MPFSRKSNWSVEAIREMIADGKTMVQIGNQYGLSRQRIKQICQKYSLPSTVETRQQIRREVYFKKWGQDRRYDDLYVVCRAKFRGKKANAKRAGIVWNINFGDIEWATHCPILGIKLDYFADERQENSPSFDRIDPAKGYVAGNVVVLSWRANRIKNDGTADEHRLIAAYIDKLAEGAAHPQQVLTDVL